ncbi:MAG TPA: hypothetical protein QGI62_06085 [Anaerolineales bacterium]|jgi:anti-sigma factor RsiW|nr:hypothetical protein [Anaerolineales bacterium]|tara:strand:- start:293 stop:1357 length:1065 start_codon:yes stop_codon:yes gene_type:complete
MKFVKTKRDRELDLLVDYIDGELTALKQERLEARLKVEPELANRLQQMRALHAEIGDLPNVPVPRNFTLGPEHKKQRRKGWSIWPIPQLTPTGEGVMGLRWVGYPAIAIAALLVVFSSLTLYQQRPSAIVAMVPTTTRIPATLGAVAIVPTRMPSPAATLGTVAIVPTRMPSPAATQRAVAMVPTETLSPATLPSPPATSVAMMVVPPPTKAFHAYASLEGQPEMSACCGGEYERSGWVGDACSMPDHSIHVTTSGSVLFNSSSDIAGFQFNVAGATVLNAHGGEAEAEDFSISANDTIVLGFSLAAATFDGCGTMVVLSLDGEPIGLSGIIVSDPDAEALPFEYFDGEGSGGE